MPNRQSLPPRNTRTSCLLLLAGCALALPASASFQDGSRSAGSALADLLSASDLEVSKARVQELHVPAAVGSGCTVQLELDGEICQLSLRPKRVLSADFELWVAAEGELTLSREECEPIAVGGEVLGWEGSRIAGTLQGGRLHAIVSAPDGRSWAIQPLAKNAGTRGRSAHISYRAQDVIGLGGVCGVDQSWSQPSVTLPPTQSPAGTTRLCELAFDSDHEFFVRNGSTVAGARGDIILIVALAEFIYERDLGLHFEIGAMIVRTDALSDPYTATSHLALIGQFRNHWNATKSFIQRDTAHLMTDKVLDNNVIGYALVGTVCTQNSAYAFSRSHWSPNLFRRVAITCHEIGHNLNALHCSGADCRIMCPDIGGCTGDYQHFGTSSVNAITSFVDSLSCLPLEGGLIPLPLHEGFEAGLSSDLWTSMQGASVTNGASEPPGGTFALELRAAETTEEGQAYIRSGKMQLGGTSQQEVSLYVQHQGPPAGKRLIVEYATDAGLVFPLLEVVSDGSIQTGFVRYSGIPQPVDHTDNFRLIMRTESDDSGGIWFVDQVHVGEPCIEPDTFCIAGSNSVSAQGAQMDWSGSASLTAADLELRTSGGPAGQPCIYFYGPAQVQVPFGNGFRCISGGIVRMTVQNFDGGGNLARPIDSTAAGFASGESWNFQCWYRDPAAGGAFFNLSDGLHTLWCP